MLNISVEDADDNDPVFADLEYTLNMLEEVRGFDKI